MKKRINITVEAKIAGKAHELGLNVSKTCENALKEAIKRLEGSNCRSTAEGCLEQQGWWGRPDSNRGPERPRLRA
jgi:post-segregation antitoxin (ccd killing protein)